MELSNLCDACIHEIPIYEGAKVPIRELEVYPKPRCKAFPNGIPKEIWDSEFDHHNPYPGDNGILFELQPGREVPSYLDDDDE